MDVREDFIFPLRGKHIGGVWFQQNTCINILEFWFQIKCWGTTGRLAWMQTHLACNKMNDTARIRWMTLREEAWAQFCFPCLSTYQSLCLCKWWQRSEKDGKRVVTGTLICNNGFSSKGLYKSAFLVCFWKVREKNQAIPSIKKLNVIAVLSSPTGKEGLVQNAEKFNW